MSDAARRNFYCPECGARTHVPEIRCWLCARQRASADVGEQPDYNPFASPMTSSQPQAEDNGWFLAMLLFAILGVVAGAWMVDFGTGTVVTAILVPVTIRTLLVFHVRSRKGISTTTLQRIRMVIESFIATTLMYTLLSFLVVASVVIAFFTACFPALAGGNESILVLGVALGGLVGFCVAGRIIFNWAKSRWRTDTEQQNRSS